MQLASQINLSKIQSCMGMVFVVDSILVRTRKGIFTLMRLMDIYRIFSQILSKINRSFWQKLHLVYLNYK